MAGAWRKRYEIFFAVPSAMKKLLVGDSGQIFPGYL